jgi:hypothetical protein
MNESIAFANWLLMNVEPWYDREQDLMFWKWGSDTCDSLAMYAIYKLKQKKL